MDMQKLDFPLLALKVTLLAAVFILGGAAAITNSPPFSYIYNGYVNTLLLLQQSIQKRSPLLLKKAYDGNGVIIHRKGAYNGLTVLQGIFPEGPQLKIIDMEGNELHRWNIDFFSIWPEPHHLPENRVPKSVHNYHTQGMFLTPDGSVIVNVGHKGTVKLDKCGNVLWTLDYMTHHSITPGINGGYWIPAERPVDEVPDELIFTDMGRPELERITAAANEGYENTILFIDSNGRVQETFSVLRALYEGGFERELYDAMLIAPADPTHLNDIEVVTAALAARIDGVSEGDLLVSLRQMNMLAILDRHDGAIKWHTVGPWIRQHDPDITADGNIVLFNNGSRKFAFGRPPGSNIMELDIASGKTKIIFPVDEAGAFYSDIMGEHQLLPNGNRMVVESRAGRLFEVGSKGEIVWDYVAPYNSEYASLIESAQRYSPDYFTVDNWSCP
jgi:hypothetical protein